jgi:hypothetical protein
VIGRGSVIIFSLCGAVNGGSMVWKVNLVIDFDYSLGGNKIKGCVWLSLAMSPCPHCLLNVCVESRSVY